MIEPFWHWFTSVEVTNSRILRFQIGANFSRAGVNQQIPFAGVLVFRTNLFVVTVFEMQLLMRYLLETHHIKSF